MSGKPSKAPPKPLSVLSVDPVESVVATALDALRLKMTTYPSVATLGLDTTHFPVKVDLRPYAVGAHPVAQALSAALAKSGKPLPFAPSCDHLEALAALGDIVHGLNTYGVREHYKAIPGREATTYDLEADAIKLNVSVFVVDSTGDQKVKDVCAAFAAGYVVRVGDEYLIAYAVNEIDGHIGYGFSFSNGSAVSSGGLTEIVHLWKVERA